MRRKIKATWIRIIAVLFAIFILYRDQTPDSFAKEREKPVRERYRTEAESIAAGSDAPAGPDIPAGSDTPAGPDIPAGSDAPTGPGNPDDTGNSDQPVKPVEKYQADFPEPDGKGGYYITRPKVAITHISENGITRYQFIHADGQVLEGELKEKDAQAVIGPEQFQEGKSSLVIWMEDEKGKKVKDCDWEKEFMIDTVPPQIQSGTPRGANAWYQNEVMLSVSAEDGEQGSQTGQIACTVGDKCIGVIEKPKAQFKIRTPSVQGRGVPVTITAEDLAGNKSQASQKLYIDNAPPKASLQGITDYMITSMPQEVCYRVEEENVLDEAHTNTEWENVDGQKTVLPTREWSNDGNGRVLKQQLNEDGIYRLSVSAKDKAGFGQSHSAQIIIDRHNPVIHYVDMMNQKYVKEFQWDYPAENLIQDFTTYVYEIRLDGKLYPMGAKVTREGAHVLRVKAVDAAGNEASAQAGFTIDRTPPCIQFVNVEENGTYEENRTFKITLKNQSDIINEIQINGTGQKINPRSKVYEYQAEEYKDYLVMAKASDKAGNVTQSQVRFKIVKKENIIQRLIKPFTKQMNGTKEEYKNEGSIGQKENSRKGYLWTVGMAAVSGTAAAGSLVYCLWKKKLSGNNRKVSK